MVTRRLDEQFQFNSNEPVQREMRDFSKAVEIRFQPLEAQSVEVDEVIKELQEVGLERINELLLPVSERLIAMAELGFLLARSDTPVELIEGTPATFIILEGPERELFTPTPFVVIQRGGRAEIGPHNDEQIEPHDDEIVGGWEDYAIAQVQNYDRHTGVLFVFLSSTYGDPGPFNDWVISAGPGVSEATKFYYERTIPAADRAEAAAKQTAEDREYVEDARRALEEAGLNPDQYVWRDGTRPFLATIAGIAPGITANDATLVTAAWTRARYTEGDNSVRTAFRDADLAVTEAFQAADAGIRQAYQAADALLLPRTGGTIFSGGDDPLTIATDGGHTRIRYDSRGIRLWTGGVRTDGAFGLADENVGAWRFAIDTNGTVDIGGWVNTGGLTSWDVNANGSVWTGGRLESGQGAYINGFYPGQPFGLIAQYPAEMRSDLWVRGGADIAGNISAHEVHARSGVNVAGLWVGNWGGWLNAPNLRTDNQIECETLNTRGDIWCTWRVYAWDVLPRAGDRQGSVGLGGGSSWDQMNAFGFNNHSDPRKKKHIRIAPPGALERMRRVPVKTYHHKDDDDAKPLRTGFDATDLHREFPDATNLDREGYPESYSLSDVIAILWQATQELLTRVEET